MKRIFVLIIIFLLGCSPGNNSSDESSNGGEGAPSIVVNISCPATSTPGQSVQCTSSIDGIATFKQWSVDGAAINSCANQDNCNISTPSAKSYEVLMLATDELGQFVQSNMATIVAGSGASVTLTCPSTGTVGTALNCTINKSGTFASHYFRVGGSPQANCNNLATCPITPTAAGTLSVVGVGVKADGTEVASSASSIAVSGTGTSNGTITLTCPSSVTVNSPVSCTVVKGSAVGNHYYKLNNSPYAPCNNLLTCSGTAPSTPSTWTVQAFGLVGATEVQSAVATITVTAGSSGGGERIDLSCSSTNVLVGQSVTCTATSATTTWVAATWMVKGVAYGGCTTNTCTGAPDAPGNWTVQVIGTLPGGRQVPSNIVNVTVTSPASNPINITCTPMNPVVGQIVTCTATAPESLGINRGHWIFDDTTQLCIDRTTCSGQIPAGTHTIYAVGFNAAGTRYESNRITMTAR